MMMEVGRPAFRIGAFREQTGRVFGLAKKINFITYF
jgi:hypothetical protein